MDDEGPKRVLHDVFRILIHADGPPVVLCNTRNEMPDALRPPVAEAIRARPRRVDRPLQALGVPAGSVDAGWRGVFDGRVVPALLVPPRFLGYLEVDREPDRSRSLDMFERAGFTRRSRGQPPPSDTLLPWPASAYRRRRIQVSRRIVAATQAARLI
jgi:hypothetical protein